MDFYIKVIRYLTLGGEKGKKFIFVVNDEEKFEESFSNKEIDELNIDNPHQMLAGDWVNAINSKNWFLSKEDKAFLAFLDENEEKINDAIARANISKLQCELKSWERYLLGQDHE